MPIRRIAFLTPGNFAEDDPAAGLEAALRLFAEGERLGFDGAWIRSRHLERSVGSAATFLAAATQRTRRSLLEPAIDVQPFFARLACAAELPHLRIWDDALLNAPAQALVNA